MKRNFWIIVSAILLLLIGVLRSVGGFVLLVKGNQLKTDVPIIASNFQIIIIAFGLFVIGVLFVLAAINLMRKYSYNSWLFCWIVLILFFLDGLLNGYVLFGQPLDQGQRINIGAIIIIGVLLFLGKSSIKSK